MATTYLALLNGTATGDTLSAANVNKSNEAVDRLAQKVYRLLGDGVLTGWRMESGAATITSGTGAVGGCYCATTTSQTISGLAAGTNYIFAKTDAGAPASGTIDFVARATSANVTNADGATNAVKLGKVTYVAATGITSIDSTLRDTWSIDHGGLTGRGDDDHSQYAMVAPATTARNTLQASAGSVVPLTLQCHTGQSTNLFVAKNYSGTAMVTIGQTGAVVINEHGAATADTRIEGDTDATLFFVDASADKVGVGTSAPTVKLSVSEAGGVTPDGGFAVRLTNKTGGSTVKGMVVVATSGTDNAFKLAPANSANPIGVVYTAAIGDGSQCWVVVAGRADVLLKDATPATRGNWVSVSDTAGRAVANATGPADTSTHWRHVGHCIETKASGTAVVAKCILQFC